MALLKAFPLMRTLPALGALLALLAAPPSSALAQSAPAVNLRDAKVYQNVTETGDLMGIVHYSLPASSWDAFGADAALLTLEQSGTVFQTRTPTATGEYVSAFYLAAGHGITWGDPITVRLESDPNTFTTQSSAEITADQVETTGLILNTDAGQVTLCNDVLDMSRAVETLDPVIAPEDWVQDSLLTIEGSNVWAGEFASLPSIIPNCFSSGVQSGMTDFDPNEEQLRSDLVADVEATAAWTRWETQAGEWGFGVGAGPEIMAALLGAAFATAVGLIAGAVAGSSPWGVAVGALTFLAVAVNVPHYLLQIIFVVATIGAIAPVAYLTARLRT